MAQPPHTGFHTRIQDFMPGSKRFLSWDKCRGLNFALEVGPFCVVSLVTLQNRSFEQLDTISARLFFSRLLLFLGSKCLDMFKFYDFIVATTFVGRLYLLLEHFFLQNHIENHRKKSLIEKFNPLHLSQLKNLLDPGLIKGEIQCMLLGLFFL